MRTAFKEWAVVVDALGCGGQIILLRKGGLAEGHGGFKIEHQQFLLFNTLFHQQRDHVIGPAQLRYDEIKPTLPPPERVRIEFTAEVAAAWRIESLAEAERLRGQHIWRDEVIASRFDWGGDQSIHALALRVRRLAEAIELPVLASYGGCKSWIDLEPDVNTTGATPVLDDPAFAGKLRAVRDALAVAAVH